ncbi:MAG: hypothetical protein LUI87_10810 [Lachnospiraceae bacterium]|nr:hypothetical protein [Lachnospiraceae bacterium]
MDKKYLEMDVLSDRIRKSGILPITTRTMVSAWMPSMLRGELVESAFLYYAQTPAEAMRRPYAWFTVDSRTGALIRFEYCVIQDFTDTEKYPLDMKLESKPLPLKERISAGKAFKAAYEASRPFLFMRPEELTAEQIAVLSQLKETMGKTIQPELMPFYQALGQEFMNWLDEFSR